MILQVCMYIMEGNIMQCSTELPDYWWYLIVELRI